MPAKKRGKGFTHRKRKKKSPSPPAASSSRGNRSPASKPKGGAGSSIKRTPSAASVRRKEKEALALSAPRRVSLRLLELKSRKMSMENGSLAATTLDVEEHGSDPREEEVLDGGTDKHVQHANNNNINNTFQGKKKSSQVSNTESDHDHDHEASEEEEEEQHDDDPLLRSPRVMEAPKIDAFDQVKEVDDDYADHAVYVYFWNTGFMVPSTDDVKKWIYSALGDKDTIGSLRHCKDLGRGFFFVYFEHALARTKALASRPAEAGVQVTVFPWSTETVNENGEQLSPRVIHLPGLPLQYLSLLPVIGRSLGAYIGSIGALDPDANLEILRACKNGWESAYNSTPVGEGGSTRIAVMMPPDVKPPAYVELQVREGVYKKQWIYEEVPGEQVGSKRKFGGGTFSRRASRKKLKA